MRKSFSLHPTSFSPYVRATNFQHIITQFCAFKLCIALKENIPYRFGRKTHNAVGLGKFNFIIKHIKNAVKLIIEGGENGEWRERVKVYESAYGGKFSKKFHGVSPQLLRAFDNMVLASPLQGREESTRAAVSETKLIIIRYKLRCSNCMKTFSSSFRLEGKNWKS